MTALKYPIGLQSFEKIIREGYLYVDKTEYIRQLVEQGAIYFLSRPRRFGKSLFLSTLQAFFEGKRELFAGLAIDSWDEWEWEEYPVIHIDFNAKDYTYKESLYEKINEQLSIYEQKYGISTPASSLDERFRNVIISAHNQTGMGVVVLIDEYDKPLLDTLHSDELKDMHRDSLRAFYSTLKSSDQYLKFCFLTGVTKIGQLNIFSGLNNLDDISITDQYAGICGITEAELHQYFNSGVMRCAERWECSLDEAYAELKQHYDGYHFSPSLLDVYNPWSALNAINKQFINIYWNQTGGGLSFLYRLLEAGQIELSELDGISVGLRQLQGINVNVNDAIPVLYQSGYLTIKDYDRKSMTFILKYPNTEVESGFIEGLLPDCYGVVETKSTFAINSFIKDLRTGNPSGFFERMYTFFEDFPYENAIKTEKDFQNIMYCVAKMMGLQTQVERHSSRGSCDMTITTGDYIYIFEFKVKKSPEEALMQIERNGYATPFDMDSRKIIRAGVEFSLKDRNITRWLIAD